MTANLENSAVAIGLEKVSFHSNPKERPKNAQAITQLYSFHTLVKPCSKFSKPGFNSAWTVNFQMFKLVLEKAEEWEIKLPKFVGSLKKQESSRKTSTSALLTMTKPLTVWTTVNSGKSFKRWKFQTTWPTSWEICMQVRKQVRTGHGTTNWFQIRKGVCQGCILSPCLFNLYVKCIMRNAGLDEAQTGIKIAGRNINNLRYIDDTTLMPES